MSNTEKYINDILVNVKPLTMENVTNYCKKSLIKHYSERKLHNLEIAIDYIERNYINITKETQADDNDEHIPF